MGEIKIQSSILIHTDYKNLTFINYMKTTSRILGIVVFFFLLGYILTYPYELSYHGNNEIILLEDTYQDTSIQELITREEFKNKVLYIKIWEPFELEVIPYTENELEKLRVERDSLMKVNNVAIVEAAPIVMVERDSIMKVNDSTELDRLDLILKGVIIQATDIEDHLKYLFEVMKDYKNRDVEFIHIANPDSDTKTKTDDLRKWKAAIKKYKIPGYHLIMNPELSEKVRVKIQKITKYRYLPHYMLVDKHGRIEPKGAPWPDNKSLLYPQLDSLLKN